MVVAFDPSLSREEQLKIIEQLEAKAAQLAEKVGTLATRPPSTSVAHNR